MLRNFMVVCLFLVSGVCFGQNYPVHVSQQLPLPVPTNLVDFYTGLQAWQIGLTLKDLSEPQRVVRVQLCVEHQKLQIKTNLALMPGKLFTLLPGAPVYLTSNDIADLLDSRNTQLTGSYASVYRQTGILPEGMHSFCVTVFDHASNERISSIECKNIWIRYLQPPLLISPQCESIVPPTNGQNILFQWQEINVFGPTIGNDIRYTLVLLEITDPLSNPYAALQNGKVFKIFERKDILGTNYQYTNADPPLKLGARYVWTLQAKVVSGASVYQNDGLGRPCWFSFGYPGNGSITLLNPREGHVFRAAEQKVFSWSGVTPHMSNQPFEYHLSIMASDSNRLSDSLVDSMLVYQFRSPKTYATTGWSHKVGMRLGPDSCYGWQVKAYSSGQAVAASRVSWFRGPPLVEKFFAGPQEVQVIETRNRDLHALSGVGFIRRNNQGDTLCFEFDSLNLARVAGRFVLQSGIVTEEGCGDSLMYADSLNGRGFFIIETYQLSYLGLRVKGSYNQVIPLVTQKKEQLRFRAGWTDFNNYGVNTVCTLSTPTRIALADPQYFIIEYDTSCTVKLINGQSHALLSGLAFHEGVKGSYGQEFKWGFGKQTNYAFMRDSAVIDLMNVSNGLVMMQPKVYTIDFSDQISAGVRSPYWKGVLVEQFTVHLDLENEASRQFQAKNLVSFKNGTGDTCTITSAGTDLSLVGSFGSSDSLLFNTFPSRADSLVIVVKAGRLGASYFKGSIRIPFLKGGEWFEYAVPIYYTGFGTGYLQEAFNNYEIEWNRERGDQKVNIRLRRGEFKDNHKLVFSAAYGWPGMEAEFGVVDGLTVWGNGNVGFWIPNGIASLYETVSAKFGGFDAHVSYLGAGRSGDLYAFGSQGEMRLADNVSGVSGAPTANAYSILRNPWISDSGDIDSMGGRTLGPFGSKSGGIGTFPDPSGGDLGALIDDAFGEIVIGNIGSDTCGYSESDIRHPMYNEGAGITLSDVKKLLMLLERFGDEEQKKRCGEIRAAIETLDEEELIELLNGLRDIRTFVNKLLGKQVGLLVQITQESVASQVDSVNGFIERGISRQVDTVYSKLDVLVTKGYSTIVERTIQQLANESTRSILRAVADASKASAMGELRRSLQSAVDENITTKFTGFIDTVVTTNVNQFIDVQITRMGHGLINKEERSQISFNGFRNDVEGLVEDVADDIKEGFSTVSLPAIGNTIAKVGEDTYKGFDWDRVGRDLISRLLGSNLEDSVKALIGDVIQRNAGDVAAGIYGGLARNINLDFSDLKDKIRQGQLSGVITFDPTYIYITTKAVDVEGFMNFTKDDPTWGDSWQAELEANMKRPFKASGKAKVLNGRKDDFNFWFVEVAIPSGMNAMAIPPMLVVDGVGGKFYHHMTYLPHQLKYIPTDTVDLGLGLDMYLIDFATYGKTVQLQVGARATFFDNGYTLGLDGKVDLGNKEGYPSIATGTGYLSFNSSSDALTGNFQIRTNTALLLCASGSMGLDIRPGWWEFYLGRRNAPVSVSVLCANFLRQDAWLTLNKQSFELGVNHRVDLNLRSPWLSIGQRQIRPFARADFRFNALVGLDLQPRFRMKDSYVTASAYAGVGCDWKKDNKQGVWELAAINFNGTLQYASEPAAKLTGTMNSRLSVLGVNVQLGMNVDQSAVP